MHRLSDLLLTTDPAQRARLTQFALAMLMMAIAVAGMQYFVWTGNAPAAPVAAWSAVVLAGMALFYALIRSGWSRRWREPSMTVAQMLFALSAAAAAYALLGAARGAVFPMLMLVLMFGMFIASAREMLWVSIYAVAVFGATMLWMAARLPAVYAPAIEGGHFLLVATMVPGVTVLARRVARLRQRSREHRAELAQALARLRAQSTRDELTGLINRRQMQLLLEQEHKRCIRSGQTFCVARLDLDRFKAINVEHGYSAGDTMLRAVAEEAARHVRASDVLARWDGEEFVLMLDNTRAALARGGLERLHEHVAALRVPHGGATLAVTFSAGLAEHLAGETVAQTLERARRALQEARELGRGRLVVAS